MKKIKLVYGLLPLFLLAGCNNHQNCAYKKYSNKVEDTVFSTKCQEAIDDCSLLNVQEGTYFSFTFHMSNRTKTESYEKHNGKAYSRTTSDMTYGNSYKFDKNKVIFTKVDFTKMDSRNDTSRNIMESNETSQKQIDNDNISVISVEEKTYYVDTPAESAATDIKEEAMESFSNLISSVSSMPGMANPTMPGYIDGNTYTVIMTDSIIENDDSKTINKMLQQVSISANKVKFINYYYSLNEDAESYSTNEMVNVYTLEKTDPKLAKISLNSLLLED